MYDELSTLSADYQSPKADEKPRTISEITRLEQVVQQIMVIEESISEPHPQITARFIGTLRFESAEAYDMLDAELEKLNYHAYLSNLEDDKTRQTIVIFRGRFATEERRWWPNAVLLVLTVLSTMWAGSIIGGTSTIFGGWPYSLCILLILGSHELGHYFAARYHNVAVTLPYFIPFPPIIGLFGTLGAFIQLREPMKNRNILFDVGAAGPLAGLIFAFPILIIGVATSDVQALPTEEECLEDEQVCTYLIEGNSIFYAITKYVIHGEFLPSETEDISINQLAFAGWTGLFVSGLNLLPVGQLDGGHILYSLIGRLAQRLYYPIVGLMASLALFINQGWFLWVILLLVFGRVHAVPLDDITPLTMRRRLLGIFTLLLFILIFIPSPINIVNLSA